MKSHSPNTEELINSVIETLAQGEALLAQLGDADYTRKLPVAFNASIGGHYRHCLDHFRSLVDSAMDGDLNYDHRERGKRQRLQNSHSLPPLVLRNDASGASLLADDSADVHSDRVIRVTRYGET